MYDEFRKLYAAIRATELRFTLAPASWVRSHWHMTDDDGNERQCAMGGIGYGLTGRSRLPDKGARDLGELMALAANNATGMTEHVIKFNDRQDKVDTVIVLLRELGDYFEALADWQHELDGYAPMEEIRVTARELVTPVGGNA